jgi:GAF domain-containing protein
VIGILAAQAGIALHNAHIFHLSVRSREKIKSLLDVIKAMHSDMGINSLMFTITQRTHTLVDADRGTLFLVDNKSQELWSMQGEVNIRIPKTAGIAGSVATTGDTINIPDAYNDPRFNKEVGLSASCSHRRSVYFDRSWFRWTRKVVIERTQFCVCLFEGMRRVDMK